MTQIAFTKMHGIGNDYIYIDCTGKNPFGKQEVEVFARRYCDRHCGIGSDGVILIKKSRKADFFMEMYNADGSQGKMCGNGIRCLAAFVHAKKLTDKTELDIDTLSGVKHIKLEKIKGHLYIATVNMGQPSFRTEDIPVQWSDDIMLNEAVAVGGALYNVTAVSMGNPHAVIFTRDVLTMDIEPIGKMMEKHRLFPEGVNVEFAEILSRNRIRMRVWERGSQETMACGTGACATAAAAVENGLADRNVTVELNRGELEINWDRDSGDIIMVGQAEIVYEGVVHFQNKETV
jgi:diaminopimelate epimerase